VFAAVRRYKIKPSKMDEVVRRVDEELLEILTKTQGFVSYYALDAGEGMLVSISVFLDEAGAEESNGLATKWARERITHLVDEPAEVMTGEVVVHGGQ
jgi:hypothetical protein